MCALWLQSLWLLEHNNQLCPHHFYFPSNSPLLEAWRRRRSPACSSQTARSLWTPKSTGVAFARVKRSASMPNLRTPALASLYPKRPSLPSTPTRPTAAPRSSGKNSPQYVATTSSLACATPGRARASVCPRLSPPFWVATSFEWNMRSWWVLPFTIAIISWCYIYKLLDAYLELFCSLQIYMHIPGSDKLVMELPLVIGTVPYNGFGSRTNSMSSQDGSVSNASNSWVSLRMPSSVPPSYCDVTRDCSLDQPLTPLLDDYDGGDSPIFMNAPQFQFPPLPAYSEVSVKYICLVYTDHWTLIAIGYQ